MYYMYNKQVYIYKCNFISQFLVGCPNMGHQPKTFQIWMCLIKIKFLVQGCFVHVRKMVGDDETSKSTQRDIEALENMLGGGEGMLENSFKSSFSNAKG